MITEAILYVSRPEDKDAALLAVAGYPVAFRVVMRTVRAGARQVGVPATFCGSALERAIAASPLARKAVLWLREDSRAPDDAVLLIPVTALAAVPTLARMLASSPTSVLGGPREQEAPLVAAAPSLTRSLWPKIVAGAPLGNTLPRALKAGDINAVPGSAPYIRVTSAAADVERVLYANLGSPIDTWLDTTLHRRLSRPLTRIAVALGITPNQVSAATLLVGLGAGWCFWGATPASAVIGLFLYVASVVLDHVDGEVARVTLTESTLGEWLDVLADTIVHALLVIAMGVTVAEVVGAPAIGLGAVAAVGVIASALLAKTWPLGPSTEGVEVVFRVLSNRDGFYALLLIFILALAFVPASLPLVMVVVALGSHAYWLGRAAHRFRPRAPATPSAAEGHRRRPAPPSTVRKPK